MIYWPSACTDLTQLKKSKSEKVSKSGYSLNVGHHDFLQTKHHTMSSNYYLLIFSLLRNTANKHACLHTILLLLTGIKLFYIISKACTCYFYFYLLLS